MSFVNTLPLIDGLENLADIELCYSVPSALLEQLTGGAVDIALCSSIDYQRSVMPLVILPAGLLGCDGPTLTVRLFSTRHVSEIQRVFCDRDSHTSITLLQILLREVCRIDPELIEYDTRETLVGDHVIDRPEAILLIGDKVVTDAPRDEQYPHQLDLGATWVEHTHLPFVFALWMARAETDPAVLAVANAVLDRQRRYNRGRIESIVHHRATPRRWPRDLAADYLSRHIAYDLTDERLAGLELFFDKAYEHGLISERRPLNVATL